MPSCPFSTSASYHSHVDGPSPAARANAPRMHKRAPQICSGHKRPIRSSGADLPAPLACLRCSRRSESIGMKPQFKFVLNVMPLGHACSGPCMQQAPDGCDAAEPAAGGERHHCRGRSRRKRVRLGSLMRAQSSAQPESHILSCGCLALAWSSAPCPHVLREAGEQTSVARLRTLLEADELDKENLVSFRLQEALGAGVRRNAASPWSGEYLCYAHALLGFSANPTHVAVGQPQCMCQSGMRCFMELFLVLAGYRDPLCVAPFHGLHECASDISLGTTTQPGWAL